MTLLRASSETAVQRGKSPRNGLRCDGRILGQLSITTNPTADRWLETSHSLFISTLSRGPFLVTTGSSY